MDALKASNDGEKELLKMNVKSKDDAGHHCLLLNAYRLLLTDY